MAVKFLQLQTGSRLLNEDGTRILLEDSTGSEQPPQAGGGGGGAGGSGGNRGGNKGHGPKGALIYPPGWFRLGPG